MEQVCSGHLEEESLEAAVLQQAHKVLDEGLVCLEFPEPVPLGVGCRIFVDSGAQLLHVISVNVVIPILQKVNYSADISKLKSFFILSTGRYHGKDLPTKNCRRFLVRKQNLEVTKCWCDDNNCRRFTHTVPVHLKSKYV